MPPDEITMSRNPGTPMNERLSELQDKNIAFIDFLDGMYLNANLKSDENTISIIRERFSELQRELVK